MRIAHSFQRRRELGASMTPMIDVVFLLLIFFVCTASFQIVESTLPTSLLAEGASQVELPPELQRDDLERIVISVGHREGRLVLRIDDRPCPSLADLSQLLDQLMAVFGADLTVIVDSDDATPIGHVIDVYDRCRLSGFQRVQFAIDKR